MKRKIQLMVNLILIAVMICSGIGSAYAASTMDAAEKVALRTDCTMEIAYSSVGTAFAGQNVKLWHIADITADAQYTLAGSFKKYPVTVTGVASNTEWDKMTVTLNSYILADGISPDYTAETDANGKVTFENLTAGLYLVGSVRLEQDGTNNVFESFAAAVPGVDENGKWRYDISAKPKMSESTPSKGEVTYKTVKIWKDNGKNRPDSITIEIFKNGALQETVALNSANNWMHNWTAIDDGSVWNVTEKNVPKGYKVGIRKTGDTFQITNTRPYSGGLPKTGDTANLTPWCLLTAVSGAVLVVLGIARRKKRAA